MKTLTLLILLNLPTGEQIVVSETVMPEAQCLEMQGDIWQSDSPITYIDSEHGAVAVVDAACVPE